MLKAQYDRRSMNRGLDILCLATALSSYIVQLDGRLPLMYRESGGVNQHFIFS